MQNINFVRRSSQPDSLWQTAIGLLKRIYNPISAAIWRKRSDDAWVKLAPGEIQFESQSFESGDLIKKGGPIYAGSRVKERFDKF